MTLLSVQNLSVRYQLPGGDMLAVEDASFDVEPGQTLGLIGESGCGKSTLATALMRLLPANASVVAGTVTLDGQDVLSLNEADLRRIRWTKMAMIFQSAMNSLNPVRPARTFLEEALRIHTILSRREIRVRVLECFDWVGLPADRIDAYPHQLSGGMKQRLVIALSLVCDPLLIIADEPTTALDVVVQDQVIAVMKSLQERLGFALVFISHDMALIAENCDRVAVMYAGQIVEQADTDTLFARPRHPYTVGLLRSVPRLRGPLREIPPLPGQPPDLLHPPVGCRFESRCPIAEQVCREVAPVLAPAAPEVDSRCHFSTDPKLDRMLTGATS